MREEVWMTAFGELKIVRWFDDDLSGGEANLTVRHFLIEFGGEYLGPL